MVAIKPRLELGERTRIARLFPPGAALPKLVRIRVRSNLPTDTVVGIPLSSRTARHSTTVKYCMKKQAIDVLHQADADSMTTTPLAKALLKAIQPLESGVLEHVERQEICENIRALTDQETVICIYRMQQEWLLAKAWSIATGSTGIVRGSGCRSKDNLERARRILSGLKTK